MEPNSWLEQQLDSQECTNKDLSRLGRLHMHGLYDATKPIDQSKLTFKFNRRGRALLDERVQQAISDKKLMMELALRALNIEYYYDFVDYLHTDSYIKLLLSLIDPWMQGHFNGARSLFHKNYFHMVCTGAIDVFYHPDIKQAIDNQILTTEQVAITLFHHTGEVKKDALPQSIEAATQELLKEIKPVAKEEGGNCLIS
jgi:hypothetical protein